MTKKNCSEYCKNSAACCKDKVDYFTWNVPVTECPEYDPKCKATHLDLDKTAQYIAQEAFGKIGWVISRPDTQQSIIAALKESLLKNCKADD